MKRLVAFIIMAVLLFSAGPARADQVSSLENVLLVQQVIDVAETWQVLRYGGSELDPLMKPFAGKSLAPTPLRSLEINLAMNAAVRMIDGHFNKRRRPLMLYVLVLSYVPTLVSNVVALNHQKRFAVSLPAFSVKF